MRKWCETPSHRHGAANTTKWKNERSALRNAKMTQICKKINRIKYNKDKEHDRWLLVCCAMSPSLCVAAISRCLCTLKTFDTVVVLSILLLLYHHFCCTSCMRMDHGTASSQCQFNSTFFRQFCRLEFIHRHTHTAIVWITAIVQYMHSLTGCAEKFFDFRFFSLFFVASLQSNRFHWRRYRFGRRHSVSAR